MQTASKVINWIITDGSNENELYFPFKTDPSAYHGNVL